MAFIKVIEIFDSPAALERAKRDLIRSGVATGATIRIEPEYLVQDLHPPGSWQPKGLWERLKEWLAGEPEETAGIYAEGVRRGSFLLVATVPEEKAQCARGIMRRHGAVDMRQRVERWRSAGWTGYDPSAPSDEPSLLTVRLFDEATGGEIGRISEVELAFLHESLEEENPDDHDYWINLDTVDMLECRLGATAHLISLLPSSAKERPASRFDR